MGSVGMTDYVDIADSAAEIDLSGHPPLHGQLGKSMLKLNFAQVCELESSRIRMKLFAVGAFALLLGQCAAAPAAIDDLKRAKTKKPRDLFKGEAAMSSSHEAAMSRYLARSGTWHDLADLVPGTIWYLSRSGIWYLVSIYERAILL
jgi:hypothetical protein